jgi:hypothetical protein
MNNTLSRIHVMYLCDITELSDVLVEHTAGSVHDGNKIDRSSLFGMCMLLPIVVVAS